LHHNIQVLNKTVLSFEDKGLRLGTVYYLGRQVDVTNDANQYGFEHRFGTGPEKFDQTHVFAQIRGDTLFLRLQGVARWRDTGEQVGAFVREQEIELTSCTSCRVKSYYFNATVAKKVKFDEKLAGHICTVHGQR
jgi:hypothetical protein